MRFAEEDPGPTGEFSPAKIAAVVFGAGAPAPLVVYLLDAGPADLSWWVALALSGGVAILAAGLWWGLGKGAFRGLAQALTNRVNDD